MPQVITAAELMGATPIPKREGRPARKPADGSKRLAEAEFKVRVAKKRHQASTARLERARAIFEAEQARERDAWARITRVMAEFERVRRACE